MQDYYEQVAEEIERKKLDNGLWVRSMAESGGDKEKTESLYIKYRVQKLQNNSEPKEQKAEYRDNIYEIAKHHKALNWCALANVAGHILFLPAYLLVLPFQLYYTYKLVKAIGSKVATLWLIGMFIPFIGLILLFILSRKGTNLLRRRGFTVGIMGANLGELEAAGIPATQSERSNALTYILLAILLFLISLVAAFHYCESRSHERAESTLMELSNEMNENLPAMLDEYTRLDNTMADLGNKLLYRHTFLNIDLELFDESQFRRMMKENLINQYRTREDMKAFRDIGVELTYVYFSETGKELASITISPKDFKKNKSN